MTNRTSDDRRSPNDTLWRPTGQGVMVLFSCMGCNQSRHTAGARGVGVRKRCAICLARIKTPRQGRKTEGVRDE